MASHLLALADYVALLDEGPFDRKRRVKAGVPARQLLELSELMGMPPERLLTWVGISRASARRSRRADAMLSSAEGEGLLAIARVVGLVAKIVAESGSPETFDAAGWTARWLDRPNPAVGGRAPGDLMATTDGRQVVESLVARMQSGAYS